MKVVPSQLQVNSESGLWGMNELCLFERKQLIWMKHGEISSSIAKLCVSPELYAALLLRTSTESEVGYVIEVDLRCPDIVHEGHQDFVSA